ncbi:706_t:CDS:2 [Acaulospora colombiana]|uniref:706_t:CDS:1 n=1 Tax=Acaulospora colombiana TaxID=27376 RepID=A0ACA9LR94_9GLOM|nr:706_t:CDS:2 [Acaulospora colombiana]
MAGRPLSYPASLPPFSLPQDNSIQPYSAMSRPIQLSIGKIFTPSPHLVHLRQTSSTTRVVWLTIFALWAEIYAPHFFEDAFEDSIIVILLHLFCGWTRSILKSITQIVSLTIFNLLSLFIYPSLKDYEPKSKTSPIKREYSSNKSNFHRASPLPSPVRPAITPIKAPAPIDDGDKVVTTSPHHPNLLENITSVSTPILKTSLTTPKLPPILSKTGFSKTVSPKGKSRKAGKAPSERGYKQFIKGNVPPKQLPPTEKLEEVDPLAPTPFQPKATRSAYLDDLADMTAFLEQNIPVQSQPPTFSPLDYKILFPEDDNVTKYDHNTIQLGGPHEEIQVSKAPLLEDAIQPSNRTPEPVKLDQTPSSNSSRYAPFALSDPVSSSLFTHEPAIVAKSGKYTAQNPVTQPPVSKLAHPQISLDWSAQDTEGQKIHDHEMVDAYSAKYHLNDTVIDIDLYPGSSTNDEKDTEMAHEYMKDVPPQYVAVSYPPICNETPQPEVLMSDGHCKIISLSVQEAICNGDMEMSDEDEFIPVLDEELSMDLSTPMSPVPVNIPFGISTLDSSTSILPSPLSPKIGVSSEPPVLDASVPVSSYSPASNLYVPPLTLNLSLSISSHPPSGNIPPETAISDVPTPITNPLPSPLSTPPDVSPPLQRNPPPGPSLLDLFADIALQHPIGKTTPKPVDSSVLPAPIPEMTSTNLAHGPHSEALNIQSEEFRPNIITPEAFAEALLASKSESDPAEIDDAESFLHFLEQITAQNNQGENDLATMISFDHALNPTPPPPPTHSEGGSNCNVPISLPLAPAFALPTPKAGPDSNSGISTRKPDTIPIYPNNIIPVDDVATSTMGSNSLVQPTNTNTNLMQITNPTLHPSSGFSTISSEDEVKIISNLNHGQQSLGTISSVANKDQLRNPIQVGIHTPYTSAVSEGPVIVSNAVASTSGSSGSTAPTNSSTTRNILPLPKPRNGGIFRKEPNDVQKTSGASSPITAPTTSDPLLRSRTRIGPSPLSQSVTAQDDQAKTEEEDYNDLMKEMKEKAALRALNRSQANVIEQHL